MNQTNLTPSKQCEFCDKVLHGRSDQRFCNDSCRNNYNRKKRRVVNELKHENIPEIMNIIKRNYEILHAQNIPRDGSQLWIKDNTEFLASGFNPKFFTSIGQYEKCTWFCVFDYGFTVAEKEMLLGWFPLQAKI